jgi:type I restriction enzyme R subunit
VDAPTCKNVVLARVVSSMSEFKQIIGRGTRVRDDYGKLWFNIVDYTGSATRMFADPTFDGDPVRITEEELTAEGQTIPISEADSPETEPPPAEPAIVEPPAAERRKFYFDGGQVAIAAHLVYELDPNGQQLRVVRYTDYAAESVRSLYPTSKELREQWMDPAKRSEIVQRLAERGIDFAELTEQASPRPRSAWAVC